MECALQAHLTASPELGDVMAGSRLLLLVQLGPELRSLPGRLSLTFTVTLRMVAAVITSAYGREDKICLLK